MLLGRKQACALVLAVSALGAPSVARAEVKLAEAGGWTVSTDGRVNAFVSHVWGDSRPEGLESLNWVGFNESTSPGQLDINGKIRKTRVRSGYVPSTLAFNFRKQAAPQLKVQSRVEVGFQITNIIPDVPDPTWMSPRAVYLDLSGNWGSVRAGRDFSLFSRGNLFMNYEIGHAYGVGFPCSYDKVFGGACGHVGFGTLWPDFRAQITYTTPSIFDVLQISVGAFDPRTMPTYQWEKTPYPRVETEAVMNYSWREGWGVKAWANGFHQVLGTTDDVDPDTNVERLQEFTQAAYGVGGGLQGNFGPFKIGGSGYMGRGMDGFTVLTFNPILVGQGTVEGYQRRFRPSKGFLAEASFKFGNTWVMGGVGQARFDRIETDNPINMVDAFPLIRSQTGISAGLFHRIDSVVVGLDYFNAHYAFDPKLKSGAGPNGTAAFVEVKQIVHIINAGVTVEW